MSLNDGIPYFFVSFEALRIQLEMISLDKNYDVIWFDTRFITKKHI
ncbi:hypothetical protein ACFLKZ_21405 [Bacillus paranthracis]